MGYDSDYLIGKHTLLPLYIPFLSSERRDKIIYSMKNSDGKGISNLLGIQAGKVFKGKSLNYCPKCTMEESARYGEAYFHRSHQVDGVLVCPEHNCLLKKYKEFNEFHSRLEYIRLDIERVDLNIEYVEDNNIYEKLFLISRSSAYLLNENLSIYNINIIHENYMSILYERGFITTNGSIKQKELYHEFKRFYSDDILNMLKSDFIEENEYNWLKNITRKQKRLVQPLRHILFIIFLCGNIESFFENT